MKDGFLLIDKPAGFTSFDVIARLRRLLNTRKIGHGGTLDPNVTGVLLILVGRATRAVDLIQRQDKAYEACIRLGVETDTQDIWGTVLAERAPELSVERIQRTIESFCGEQLQLPPMYSALKINGVRLYDLARQGKQVQRRQRPIKIYKISFLGPTEQPNEYRFALHCSKGTYVRTLCADIGSKLGCGACMSALRRTASHGFSIEQCVTLQQVEAAAAEGRADELLRPVRDLFYDLPPIRLSEKQTFLYRNGVGLDPARVPGVLYDSVYPVADFQQYTVYGADGVFLGIGQVDYDRREFRSIKMFISEENGDEEA